jgi:hypothetical protein
MVGTAQLVWADRFFLTIFCFGKDNFMLTMTWKMLQECHTKSGGLTAETLRHLGLRNPLPPGWRDKLIGSNISQESFDLALAGRDILKSKKGGYRKCGDTPEEEAVIAKIRSLKLELKNQERLLGVMRADRFRSAKQAEAEELRETARLRHLGFLP